MAANIVEGNFCRVGLEGDAVVAALVHKVADGDIPRAVRVDSVRVLETRVSPGESFGVEVGGIDIALVVNNVCRIPDKVGPELRLDNLEAIDDTVPHTLEGHCDGATVLVADPLRPVIPRLAIAIDSSRAVAVDYKVVTLDDEREALILEGEDVGFLDPRVDVVGREAQPALDRHIHVLKVKGQRPRNVAAD